MNDEDEGEGDGDGWGGCDGYSDEGHCDGDSEKSSARMMVKNPHWEWWWRRLRFGVLCLDAKDAREAWDLLPFSDRLASMDSPLCPLNFLLFWIILQNMHFFGPCPVFMSSEYTWSKFYLHKPRLFSYAQIKLTFFSARPFSFVITVILAKGPFVSSDSLCRLH